MNASQNRRLRRLQKRALKGKGRPRATRENVRRVLALDDGDVGMVIKADGSLRFNSPHIAPGLSIVQGSAIFWGGVLRWLFAGNKDAEERRQILVDDFLLDIQEIANAQKAAADEPPEVPEVVDAIEEAVDVIEAPRDES